MRSATAGFLTDSSTQQKNKKERAAHIMNAWLGWQTEKVSADHDGKGSKVRVRREAGFVDCYSPP
jgi:hypothetical protein